jgi:hypothetical protein
MTVQTIVSALINTNHGWSVRDQFEDTFDGSEDLEDQNPNALELVSATIKDLLESELLADSYELDELRRYHDRIKAHLMEN